MTPTVGQAIVSLTLIAGVPVATSTASRVAVQRLDAFQNRFGAADLSADGQFVAFVSWAALSARDTNNQADVYVMDRTSGRVTLESLRFDGGPANGASGHPRISGDGRLVVFSSTASNIVPPPGSSLRVQVFLRDRRTGRTMLVSRTTAGGISNGGNDEPDISEDGRVIAFVSTATDLTHDPDANGMRQDVYRYELETGAMVRISVDTRGEQSSSGTSFAPAVSGDGRFVSFTSSASLDRDVRLPTGAGPRDRRAYQVFVRDTETGTTQLASRTPEGREGNGHSFHPAISDDGRVVAFVSSATDLVRTDKNRLDDAFRYDTASGRTTLVSRNPRGESADGRSDWPALSTDGRYVAFASEASNLLSASSGSRAVADLNLVADVFVSDSMNGTVVRVSGGDAASGPWWEPSTGPTLDATGRHIAFSSRHPIDEDDVGSDFDLFVRAVDEGPLAKAVVFIPDSLVSRPRSPVHTEGGDAPGAQGARRAHTGRMQPTSNPPSPGYGETSPKPGRLRARAEAGAAPRDAAPAECNRTAGTRHE